jgi:hypothetical protein
MDTNLFIYYQIALTYSIRRTIYDLRFAVFISLYAFLHHEENSILTVLSQSQLPE